jgi:periplasmic divalent cation tolerance protein
MVRGRVNLGEPMAPVVCLVTAPPDGALRIAQALVERELAACVNIVGSVGSVYRWKGAVEHDEESLLVIKTTRDAVPALDDALGELHPYDTFELVALAVAGGSADYLDWIGESVAPQSR